jgi:hypothetical protein
MHCTESLMLLCFFTKVLAYPNLRLNNTLVYSCPTLTRTFPGTERVLNHYSLPSYSHPIHTLSISLHYPTSWRVPAPFSWSVNYRVSVYLSASTSIYNLLVVVTGQYGAKSESNIQRSSRVLVRTVC